MQKIREYLGSRRISFVYSYDTIEIQNMGIPLFYVRKYKNLYSIYFYSGVNSTVCICYYSEFNIISAIEKLIRKTFPKTKEISLNRNLYSWERFRDYIENILNPKFIDYIC